MYYKERHEYTAVIELSHNITDIIGDDALVIDVGIVPDNRTENLVELLSGASKLEYNKMEMSWNEAEDFCVSKGGHLASVASHCWRKLQAYIAHHDLYDEPIWFGGRGRKEERTDEAIDGEWTWTDGSKWSEEHWGQGRPLTSGWNCLYSFNDEWYAESCHSPLVSICSLPTRIELTNVTRLVFTSENISTPAIQFRWVTQQIGQEKDEEFDENGEQSDLDKNVTDMILNPIGGFKLSWQLLGSVR